MQIWICLDMHRNHLRTGFYKLRSVRPGLSDHQVCVDWQASETGKRFHNRQTDRDVGDEMTVHHVDVQNVGSAAFDGANFLAQTREVGRQNRRGDFDISIEHSLDPSNCVTGYLVGLRDGRRWPRSYRSSVLVIVGS